MTHVVYMLVVRKQQDLGVKNGYVPGAAGRTQASDLNVTVPLARRGHLGLSPVSSSGRITRRTYLSPDPFQGGQVLVCMCMVVLMDPWTALV